MEFRRMLTPGSRLQCFKIVAHPFLNWESSAEKCKCVIRKPTRPNSRKRMRTSLWGEPENVASAVAGQTSTHHRLLIILPMEVDPENGVDALQACMCHSKT
jgi:hypothetical protein